MKHRSTAVASVAIEEALRGKPFQVSDVQRAIEDPPSRQTIYRVCRQLEADGWIVADGQTWKPGAKPELLADVEGDRDSRGFDLRADDIL